MFHQENSWGMILIGPLWALTPCESNPVTRELNYMIGSASLHAYSMSRNRGTRIDNFKKTFIIEVGDNYVE